MQPPAPRAEPPPTGTTVALYSGGVDSYCMAALTNPDVLLNVEMGGRYGPAEAAHLRTPPGMENRLVRINADILGHFELPDSKIIPGRNAILALIASNYGDNIIMGSVDSSTGHDKDPVFCTRINALFRWMYQPSRWLPDGRHVRVHLPVYHLTKTQIVGQVLARGHNPELLAWNTFSCYEPHTIYKVADNSDESSWLEGVEHKACGQCPPCGRKWMALTVYGVDVGFDGHQAIKHYYREWQDGRSREVGRSEQFIADMLEAWDGRRRPLPAIYPPPRFMHPDRVPG